MYHILPLNSRNEWKWLKISAPEIACKMLGTVTYLLNKRHALSSELQTFPAFLSPVYFLTPMGLFFSYCSFAFVFQELDN